MNETKPVIGVDESGKGDYFGPLVIAGVFIDGKSEKNLNDLNIRDSKLIADGRIMVLAAEIKKHAVYSVVAIGPEKYNELYSKIMNLNKLLAWGHARVIEDLLETEGVECDTVISDKFGNDRFIKAALMEKGKDVKLVSETKAERYFAVACASILARAGFLEGMAALSKEIGFELPKGASKEAEEGARRLQEKNGQEIFFKVAKLHFKTTQKIKQKEILL